MPDMATLHRLSENQIAEALTLAVQRAVPLTVTTQHGDTWSNAHSYAMAADPRGLTIAQPEIDSAPAPLAQGQSVAVSFKLRHHKHLFSARVLSAGDSAAVLELPRQMQRLQRRAYFRADVPANRIVRVSMWLGGVAAEPQGTTAAAPVWAGKVTNISAGGFQAQMHHDALESVEEGDIVGVRIAFGASSGQTVRADAQFRHAEARDGAALMGFQFMGLGQAPAGEQALQLIAVKVAEYQRLAESEAHAQAQSE